MVLLLFVLVDLAGNRSDFGLEFGLLPHTVCVSTRSNRYTQSTTKGVVASAAVDEGNAKRNVAEVFIE